MGYDSKPKRRSEPLSGLLVLRSCFFQGFALLLISRENANHTGTRTCWMFWAKENERVHLGSRPYITTQHAIPYNNSAMYYLVAIVITASEKEGTQREGIVGYSCTGSLIRNRDPGPGYRFPAFLTEKSMIRSTLQYPQQYKMSARSYTSTTVLSFSSLIHTKRTGAFFLS